MMEASVTRRSKEKDHGRAAGGILVSIAVLLLFLSLVSSNLIPGLRATLVWGVVGGLAVIVLGLFARIWRCRD